MTDTEYVNRFAASAFLNDTLSGFGRSEMWLKTGRNLRPSSSIADYLVALALIDRDGDYQDPDGWEWAHVWEVVREWMVGAREE